MIEPHTTVYNTKNNRKVSKPNNRCCGKSLRVMRTEKTEGKKPLLDVHTPTDSGRVNHCFYFFFVCFLTNNRSTKKKVKQFDFCL